MKERSKNIMKLIGGALLVLSCVGAYLSSINEFNFKECYNGVCSVYYNPFILLFSGILFLGAIILIALAYKK
jgi:hypothetical protein